MDKFVIAIDGPASSGKGTLAHALGDLYQASVLDTGLLYRYVGLAALQAGLDSDDDAGAGKIAISLMKQLKEKDLENPDLRSRKAAHGASVFSALPSVRAALLDYQRDFAARDRAILDGRDIGITICPDAPVKFFVTASPEVRAARRVKDFQMRGVLVEYADILKDIRERDERDSTRTISPTRAAHDAHLIDTSERSINDVVAHAATIIDRVFYKK